MEYVEQLRYLATIIKNKPSITYPEIMNLLKLKQTALYERIKVLKSTNVLVRKGGRTKGEWIINMENLPEEPLRTL